jgi:hypothetical protein
MNMVSNAAEAMESSKKGTLSVESWSGGEKGPVYVSFSDTGVGISSDGVEQAVRSFLYHEKKGKGVGLGLSVVYGIIKAHKGSISVDSLPGEGARFIIRLPLSGGQRRAKIRNTVKRKPKQHCIQTCGGKMSKTRIMVVDDELIIRESLAAWLERDGHHVEMAASGEEAWKNSPTPISISCWWISKWKE